MAASILKGAAVLLYCGICLSATPVGGASADGIHRARTANTASSPFTENIIVFTANQGFFSRIYFLRMDGSVLHDHEFESYRFVDLEVVNSEVCAVAASQRSDS